jgi:hypothetical protein
MPLTRPYLSRVIGDTWEQFTQRGLFAQFLFAGKSCVWQGHHALAVGRFMGDAEEFSRDVTPIAGAPRIFVKDPRFFKLFDVS